MDNISRSLDGAPDVPAQLVLIAFVSLWGLLTCCAALQVATLGY